MRAGLPMLVGFGGCLTGGVPIGFALAFTALIYIWIEGALPGLIFAQQMARGIDNFVLLAIPFFILVGYLMEANGMSVRLIALLERLVGRVRGGLNVVMVLSMVIFSGISGSKMADLAAVGSVLIPAARRSGQNPGSAVALLAASAVMAETIPPCINLIILGFVANLSIGGLFVAEAQDDQDRKSTRLNSSHANISYAVFCLKKKKKKTKKKIIKHRNVDYEYSHK